MPKLIQSDVVPRLLKPGMVVYAPGVSGESPVFVQALREVPEASAGVRFVGVWLPGFNRMDYAGLHPEARATAFFIGSDLHQSFAAGRIDYLPISYFNIWRYFAELPRVDLALLHVSAPDDKGRVSLGIANDFTPAIVSKAAVRIAHMNPAMPRTPGAATLALDDLDFVIEAEVPLAGERERVDPTFATIGGYLASLVRDGDTLELGIGRVQGCLAALAPKRNIAIHTGAITDVLLDLDGAGALASRPGAITTGIAWGSSDLYRFLTDDPRVRFAPVGYTHDVRTLASIERFVAVNTVIEIDLMGQVNAEMVGGRQISSAGGLTDFMRGARLSPGGFSVIALQAAARGGTVTRVVPELAAGTAVSAVRGDVDYVITEYGIADLRFASTDARAHALINVAAPQFRPDLEEAWSRRRSRM